MTRYWNELEGVSLAGRYWLKQCLSSTANDAWYLTRFDAACDAAVRVIRADAPFANDQLEVWRGAMSIEHPHIVRMLDAGRAEAEGTDVIYAVCEYPDDFLAGALAERPLSTAEAGEVLSACLSALGYLHANGFVHGAVAAERIMAIGDKIKLPSDSIRRAGARGAAVEAEAYDAPEVAAGGAVTPASDMWALGATVVEILTRERPAPGAELGYLPEPFATIVKHTLRDDPTARWSVEEIEHHLHPPAPPPPPEPVVEAAPVAGLPPIPEPEFQPVPAARADAYEPPIAAEIERPARLGLAMKWVPLAGVIAAMALGVWFLPHGKQPVANPSVQAKPAAPAAVPTPTPPPPRHVEPPPAPRNVQARSNPEAVWRVVVYEYSRRSAAEQRARRINDKRPGWRAEVFTPKGDRAPYLVAIGGRMTLPEAERLRRQARAAGLPRDTFVRNYPR